jgi:hypothetical protein
MTKKASLWDVMGLNDRKTSVFWIFYSVVEAEESNFPRYDAFCDAIEDNTDHQWPGDTSFFLVRSTLPIRELAQAISKPLDLNVDTLLIGHLDSGEVIHIGNAPNLEILADLIPAAKPLA